MHQRTRIVAAAGAFLLIARASVRSMNAGRHAEEGQAHALCLPGATLELVTEACHSVTFLGELSRRVVQRPNHDRCCDLHTGSQREVAVSKKRTLPGISRLNASAPRGRKKGSLFPTAGSGIVGPEVIGKSGRA
jgi:hypothetical protein